MIPPPNRQALAAIFRRVCSRHVGLQEAYIQLKLRNQMGQLSCMIAGQVAILVPLFKTHKASMKEKNEREK